MKPALVIAAVIALLCLASSPASAQAVAGCSASALSNPPRQTLDCGRGLVIEIENAAELINEVGGEGFQFKAGSGAVLIEVTPGTPFQIRTPHAIASVRGTRFVVDTLAGSTSVLVLEGNVAVGSAEGGGSVILGPNQGIDVSPGQPLVPVEWGQQRIATLLARLGR